MMILCLSGLLLVFVGCKAHSEKTAISSDESVNAEKKTNKKVENKSTKDQETKEFEYTYNPERPLWILIDGTNEILKADGNYYTMVAMESVQDAHMREKLQKKYDEGYAIKLQLEKDEPTGIIVLTKAEDKKEELKLDKKQLAYQQGKTKVDQLSEEERKRLESKVDTSQNNDNTQGAVKNFDEAVSQAKKLLNFSDEEAENYSFYDFGLGNDGREFYQIVVRSKDDTSNSEEIKIKVYADSGEAVYGE